MKIVIVDDSPADRNLCRTLLLEAYGPQLEYIEAATAAQGLEICRGANVDCVLVEYRLPGMNGTEFVAKLVAGEPGSAVVMLTGLDSGEVASAALKAGANDFLLKDRISADVLQLAIEKAIQKLNLVRMLNAERDRLAVSLSEKEVLLKEVHHRVKNNLQVIASLLRMQTAGLEDGHTVRALRESQHRVESMALVHEQLYESEDFRGINLTRYVSMLVGNLWQSYGVDPTRVSCHESVDGLPFAVDQAIPLGLILTELISNALIHGFPEGRSGSIQINCHRADRRILLEVSDDGVGLPGGMEPQQSNSLGLKIVKILSHQLKGEFSWKGGTPGITFTVSFPEHHAIGKGAS